MQSQPEHSLHRGMRVAVTMDDGRMEPGAVQHWRMGPPDYQTPEFVSVLLDSRFDEQHYSGTMVRAEQLAPIKTETVEASAGAQA